MGTQTERSDLIFKTFNKFIHFVTLEAYQEDTEKSKKIYSKNVKLPAHN